MPKRNGKTHTARSIKTNSNLVWGAKNIGRELGLSADQVYYHYERGRLPIIHKMGPRLLFASRAELREAPALLTGTS
jgi:hypothetical protein